MKQFSCLELTSTSPSPKSQIQAQREREIWTQGCLYNRIGPQHPPIHPQLLSMKDASSNITQRVKVTQYDPLYQLSTKKHVESKRENTDEFNMIKENIVMFFESLW